MITSINIPFTPCPDPPVGGYNIEYRVVGDVSYINAGDFTTSPAVISVSYPDGTEFEGIVHSPCGDVVWSTAGSDPGGGCTCRFAYPSEDDTAAETRSFAGNDHPFSITNVDEFFITTDPDTDGVINQLKLYNNGANGTTLQTNGSLGSAEVKTTNDAGGPYTPYVRLTVSDNASLDTVDLILNKDSFQLGWASLGNASFYFSNTGITAIPLGLPEYADDTAAAAASHPIGGLYRTGSVVKIRVT